MAETQTRVGGSTWTTFRWQGKRIALARTISDTAPAPVAGAVDIHPLDQPHPIEIVTPRAVTSGSLRVTLWELWNGPTWTQLAGLERASGILDIFRAQVSLGDITCQKVISLPNGGARVKNYYGCRITDANDSETIEIGTMSIAKDLTIRYTDFSVI